MTQDVSALIAELRKACVGHPAAEIPWPHRLLHEAAKALTALQRQLENAEYDMRSASVYCAQKQTEAIALQARAETLEAENDDLRQEVLDAQQPRGYEQLLRRTKAAEARAEKAEASVAQLLDAVEFAHSEGFDWPSDPLAGIPATSEASARVIRDAVTWRAEWLEDRYKGAEFAAFDAVEHTLSQSVAALLKARGGQG